MGRRATALLLIAALGAARGASAYEPKEAARDHYARGLVLANERNYSAALQEFDEAYSIRPEFAVLFNIGQAHAALGQVVAAIDTLTRYLKDGQDLIPAPRRQQVASQIASLHGRLASLFIITDPPGATVAIDGRWLGSAPLEDLVRVDPGTHKVTAVAEGVAPISRIVTVAEGERQHVHILLPPPSPEAALAAARKAAATANDAAVAAVRAAKDAEAAARVVVTVATRPSPKALAAARKASADAARAADMAGSAAQRENAARTWATPGGGGR
jgi:tetratricopeptide (TPR) repeat protein